MKIKNMLYIGLVSLMGYTANSQVTGALQQSQIISQGNKPVVRTEAMMNNMPLSSDAYILREQGTSGNTLYKFRAQSMPIQYGPASIGIAGQYVDNGKTTKELGLAAKVSAKNTDIATAVNAQYFPKNDKLDYYGIASSGPIFADALGSWNTKNGTGFIRPGIDYIVNIGDVKVGAGIEAKFQGKLNDLSHDYTGLRLKVKI
jgi:hypothetical protein